MLESDLSPSKQARESQKLIIVQRDKPDKIMDHHKDSVIEEINLEDRIRGKVDKKERSRASPKKHKDNVNHKKKDKKEDRKKEKKGNEGIKLLEKIKPMEQEDKEIKLSNLKIIEKKNDTMEEEIKISKRNQKEKEQEKEKEKNNKENTVESKKEKQKQKQDKTNNEESERKNEKQNRKKEDKTRENKDKQIEKKEKQSSTKEKDLRNKQNKKEKNDSTENKAIEQGELLNNEGLMEIEYNLDQKKEGKENQKRINNESQKENEKQKDQKNLKDNKVHKMEIESIKKDEEIKKKLQMEKKNHNKSDSTSKNRKKSIHLSHIFQKIQRRKKSKMKRRERIEKERIQLRLRHRGLTLKPKVFQKFIQLIFDSTSRKHSKVNKERKDQKEKQKQTKQEDPIATSPKKIIKPNFEPTGILATFASNNVGGTILRFTEPLDSQIPPQTQKWKLFPFKGDDALPTIYLRGQSCFLIGRDMNVADIPLTNPSISAQHAVIQFRQRRRPDDPMAAPIVKPYIMDLDTTNGSYLNSKRIEGARYYELMDKDVLRFGASQRDYVLMLDESRD